jgi:hypothetical protein
MATAKSKEQQRIARIRNHPANKKALAGMKRKYVRKVRSDASAAPEAAKFTTRTPPMKDVIAYVDERLLFVVNHESAHMQVLLKKANERIDKLQVFVNQQADAIVKLQFPAVAGGRGKVDIMRDLFDNPPRSWELMDLTGIPGQADKPKAPDWRSVVMESSRKENERLRLEGVRKDEVIERQRKTITKLCTMVPHDVLKKAMEG